MSAGRPTRLLIPPRADAWAGVGAAVVNALARVAVIPVFVAPLVDGIATAGRVDELPRLLAAAAALVVGSSLALWLQDALLARAAAHASESWRERLFRALLDRSPGNQPGTSGGLSSRILHDLKEVESFQQYGLGTLVAETVAVLAILGFLASMDALATGLLLALLLPLAVALRLVGRQLERTAERSQEGAEELGARIQEGIRHHETIRAFGAVDFLLARFRPVNRRTAAAMTRRGALAALQVPLTQVLAFLAIGGLVVMLATAAARGTLTVGEIVSFVTLTALLSTPAQLLPRGLAMAQQAATAANRLRRLLEKEADHRVGFSAAPRPSVADAGAASQAGEVMRLESVSVGYGATAVLGSIDLCLAGSGLVALTGASGSGKTTLLRTLLRFQPPLAGRILLQGSDLALWPEHELRHAIGYVPQEGGLLRASLRDNLLLGRRLADERLWEVLAEVGMAEAVSGLRGGLDAVLGEDGSGLSGGQRQRLAIARALLSEPALLLLDEPTSNLDESAEGELVDLLMKQARNRAILAVTHRPALAVAASRQFRVAGGTVIAGLAATGRQ